MGLDYESLQEWLGYILDNVDNARSHLNEAEVAANKVSSALKEAEAGSRKGYEQIKPYIATLEETIDQLDKIARGDA